MPCLVTRDVAARYREELKKFASENQARVNNGERFREFCRLNDLPLRHANGKEICATSLLMFRCALLSASRIGRNGKVLTYKPSSVEKQIKDAQWAVRRNFELLTASDVVAMSELGAARSPTKTAPAVHVREIVTRLRSLPTGCMRDRCFDMLLVGLRNADLNEMDDIAVEDDAVCTQVYVAKNRRKRSRRAPLSVENSWSFWWLLDGRAKRHLREYKKFHVATDKLDHALKSLGLTSYSLRRCYVQQVIAWATDDRGVIDWSMVKQKTLHIDEATVQAFYVKAGAGWRPEFIVPNSW